MTTNHENSEATPEVANIGVFRPPIVYLGSILTGLALAFIWPLPLLGRMLSVPLGSIMVLAAIALFSLSLRELKVAGTSVRGSRPTTAIIRRGPYRFSRNPIYLSFSLLQLGVAIWVNSLWVLATLIVAFALISFVVIAREEQYLEKKFGAEYLEYKASVRRWL